MHDSELDGRLATAIHSLRRAESELYALANAELFPDPTRPFEGQLAAECAELLGFIRTALETESDSHNNAVRAALGAARISLESEPRG